MRQVLLVRFGEVHLKGLNRPYFLKKLTDNVKRAVKPLGGRAWLSAARATATTPNTWRQAAKAASMSQLSAAGST